MSTMTLAKIAAARTKMNQLGMMPSCGYWSNHFLLRRPISDNTWRDYTELPTDLLEIVMHSKAFDAALYYTLCVTLDIEAEAALRICLS